MSDQDREAVAYMGKSIADMVIEWVDRADGLGWRVGLQKVIELRLYRLLKERDAHERARAASAPQVEPMAWVNESHRDQIIDRSGSVYWYAPMMCGKKFEGSFPVYLAAPVASHEPASVSEGAAEQCATCAGNGEVVVDWDRYLHGLPGDAGDEGTAECPDCDGIGEVTAPPPEPAKSEVVAWQWRYRTKDETIGGFGEWSEWSGGHLPILRGDDYEVEERPLYAAPPADPSVEVGRRDRADGPDTEAVVERDKSFLNLSWIKKGREYSARLYEPQMMECTPALADVLALAVQEPSATPPTAPAAEVVPGAAYGIIDPDYARVFVKARAIAWQEGYAIMMHGSFTRDLDLLAVPWTEHACEPEHLVKRLEFATGLKHISKDPGVKPHGRLAWTLTFPEFGDPRFVDVGVLPRLSTAPAVHHDDLAVDRFATAMKAKLASKRALGYGGWDDPARCSNEHLSQLLHGHVGKGDPVDVANFAMMLHQRGERILSAPIAPAAARSAAEEVQHECVCGHRWKAPMRPDQNCPACNPGEEA